MAQAVVARPFDEQACHRSWNILRHVCSWNILRHVSATKLGLSRRPVYFVEYTLKVPLHLLEIALSGGCAGGGWFALEYPFKPHGDHGADYRARDVNPCGAHIAADQIGGE
jgi:hypothetical protein